MVVLWHYRNPHGWKYIPSSSTVRFWENKSITISLFGRKTLTYVDFLERYNWSFNWLVLTNVVRISLNPNQGPLGDQYGTVNQKMHSNITSLALIMALRPMKAV